MKTPGCLAGRSLPYSTEESYIILLNLSIFPKIPWCKHFASAGLASTATDRSRWLASDTLTLPTILGPEARRPRKHQIKLWKALLGRDTTLDWQINQ